MKSRSLPPKKSTFPNTGSGVLRGGVESKRKSAKPPFPNLSVTEQLADSIFNATTVGMCITNEKGLFVDVNDAYCRIYGYTREELIGQSFTMMVGPSDRKMMQKLHDDFIEGGAEPPTEFDVVDKAGRMLTLAVNARLLVQPDGTRYKVTSVRDITTIKLNEEHLEVLSRNLPVAIFRYKLHTDGHEELMYLSEGAREIWGLDPELCMREPSRIWDLYHPDDLLRSRKLVEDSALNLTPWQAEWRVHHPDGSLRWQRGIGNPKRSADGGTIWDSIIIDITPQKEAKQGLEEALEQLKERVKEQDCLHKIAKLDEHRLSVEELLNRAVLILPSGFQKEELAEAAIKFDRRLHATKGYRHQPTRIQAVSHRIRNRPLEIRGTYRKRTGTRNPFLKEERHLLRAVADLLSLKIAQIENKRVLLESEGVYRTLFEGSPIPRLIYSIQKDRIIDVNQAALDFYGYSRKILSGPLSNPGLEQSGIPALLHEKMDTLSRTGIYELGVFRHFTKAGREVFVQAFSHPIQIKGEACLSVVCLDVTEQTKAIHQLRDSEEKLRQAVSIAKLGYWERNLSSDTVFWSEEVYRIWGRAPREFTVTYKAFLETVHPEDRSVYEAERKAALESGQAFDCEHRILHPDGSIRWVHEMGDLTRDADGQPILFSGTVQDITARKLAEDRLRESNERFQKVADATHDAIWDWNIVENTIYRGKAFERYLGLEAVESTDPFESWKKHVHPDDKQAVISVLQAAMDDPREHHAQSEYRFRRVDGTYAHVEDRAIIIRDARGRPIRLVGAMSDISYRKEHEETLERLNADLLAHIGAVEDQNARLREIAWIQSHVVRAPLARILGLVEAIRSGSVSPEEQGQFLRHLGESASELDGIIRDIVGKAEAIETGLSGEKT